MAVTSAGSAELIAVSSLITYDVYRTYKNPKATGKQLLKVSRTVIVIFGLGMGVLAGILLGMGLSLGFVYLAMGILIGSAVIPIALTITWSKTTRAGAVAGALIGDYGIITHMDKCGSIRANGVVDISSLGGAFPMLYGNVVAFLLSGLICVVVSLAQNKKYDWNEMNQHMNIVEADMSDKLKQKLQHEHKTEETLKKAYKFSLQGRRYFDYNLCSNLAITFVLLWICIRLRILFLLGWNCYSLGIHCIILHHLYPNMGGKSGISQVFSGKKAPASESSE